MRVPPSGTWEKHRADLYGLAEDWLGAWEVTEAQGLAHLVHRCLGGFGPASLKDAANWAGLPVTTLRPVVEQMDLRRFRDEKGENTPRSAPGAAAGPGYVGAGPLPADVGRNAARARPADPDPPRGLPAPRVPR